MHGYTTHIDKATRENEDFRKVLYTSKYMQLVLMSLKGGEEIGEETHTLDQFIRVEEGTGKSIINGNEQPLLKDDAVIIPAGTLHNIINTGSTPMKLYTIYAPPEHEDGIIRHTKEDAESTPEHFDGETTE